ncbi:2-oxoacid dehydrogenases acyltransferase-domain-containing protein [Mycena filopes]|nr:2-oxoacid dehydrogenases acyltransferase-domain-containing protein [Mycena filopes]
MFLRSLRSPRLVPLFRPPGARFASRTVTHTFKLADIGEGITECEVIRWSVAPLSAVAAFDPLCEVQSDKASVEITSPWDGVLKEVLVQEGQVAKVGQGLCLIEVEEEVSSTDDVREEPTKAADSLKEEPTVSPQEPREESTLPETESIPTPTPTRRPHPLDPSFPPPSGAGAENVFAAPSTRHFARTQGVDLAQLAPGSGKGGRIEKSDVEAFLASSSSSSPASTDAPPKHTKSGEDVVVELSRTRHAMWRAMVKSLEIPQFGYSAMLDITELHALLPLLNAHIPAHYLPPSASPSDVFDPAQALGPGVGLPPRDAVPETGRYTRVTYLPFLLKTLARTMMDWPLFRASITSPSSSSTGNGKPSLTIRPHADLALALATPSGLYTPLLRAADSYPLYALASQVAHLAALGRRVPSGLTREHLSGGGTISVSNVGAAGRGTGAAPVLIPGGGVAIVALGRAEWVMDVSERHWPKSYREEAEEDEASPRRKSKLGEFVSQDTGSAAEYGRGARRLKLPVSWAADHRVVEGAEMAAFVEAWRGWVERPGRMIGEGV